jgi:ABC-type transport system involved in Fe-S cluster assembly fused permease/ATPase subunit
MESIKSHGGAYVKHSAARNTVVREAVKLFLKVASPYVKRRLVTSLVITVVISFLGSVGPILIKMVVDSFGTTPVTATAAIAALVLLYVSVQWLSRVLGGIQAFVLAQADRRMHRVLSDCLFDHVIRLPLRFHLQRRTGAVAETLTTGLLGYQLMQQVLLSTALPMVVQLATVSVVLLALDQAVILVLFLLATVAYGVAFTMGAAQARREARRVSAGQIDTRALMTDSLLNFETVKYFTAEPVIRARLDRALMQSEQDWMRFYSARVRNAALVATVFAAFLAPTMVYAVYQVTTEAMTVGTFVLVNAYLLQLVAPVEMIGAATQTLSQGLSFLERMLELFRENAEPPASPKAVPLQGPGKLVFDRVSVGYNANQPTLQDVSFVLPAGGTLGIVGASGAGKSTLVRLLTRLIEPDSGRILIDDVPITKMEIASVRGAIAVVPQDTVLFNDTIAYNIGFGRPGCSQQEIEEAARTAELHDFIMRLPEGYATQVGERGVRLSGGEKQRVSIARAALKRPRMFVFDEATSSLDSRTEQEILKNLRALAARSTTVVVAHRLSTVMHADQILVLHGGVVVEMGNHHSLLLAGGRYAELWRAQQASTAEATAPSAA